MNHKRLDRLEAKEAVAAQACAVHVGMGQESSVFNVNRGAIAIGASGARITVELLRELQRASRAEQKAEAATSYGFPDPITSTSKAGTLSTPPLLKQIGIEMTAAIIDGNRYAEVLRTRVAEHVARLKSEHGITPGLAVIIVGEDPASHVYVMNKTRQTAAVGMNSHKHELPAHAQEAELLALIRQLNADPTVHGILVQMPVPKHIDPDKVIGAIDPAKDVDCFTPANVGKLQIGLHGPVSCTPLGCLMLLREVLGSLEGKREVARFV